MVRPGARGLKECTDVCVTCVCVCVCVCGRGGGGGGEWRIKHLDKRY